MEQFPILITVVGFEEIFLFVAAVGLLDATSRGCVVARHGEADGRLVGEHDLLLHQPFAEGATAYDGATVVVLQGTGYDLAGTGRLAVDEHHHGHVFQHAATARIHVLPRAVAAFGIDDEAALGQELVGDVDGGGEVASRVATQVENELLHALLPEVGNALLEFLDGGGRELAEFEVADVFVKHVGDVDAVGRDGIARDGVVEEAVHATAPHLHLDFGTLRSFQLAHHVFVGQFLGGHKGVVHIDDAVAGEDAHLLGGSAFDDIDDGDGVPLKAELHADAVEATEQRVVDLVELL